jgi:hypothetical protein
LTDRLLGLGSRRSRDRPHEAIIRDHGRVVVAERDEWRPTVSDRDPLVEPDLERSLREKLPLLLKLSNPSRYAYPPATSPAPPRATDVIHASARLSCPVARLYVGTMASTCSAYSRTRSMMALLIAAPQRPRVSRRIVHVAHAAPTLPAVDQRFRDSISGWESAEQCRCRDRGPGVPGAPGAPGVRMRFRHSSCRNGGAEATERGDAWSSR